MLRMCAPIVKNRMALPPQGPTDRNLLLAAKHETPMPRPFVRPGALVLAHRYIPFSDCINCWNAWRVA